MNSNSYVTLNTPESTRDPNCDNFDILLGKCLKCAIRFYLNNNNCLGVNPLCADWNPSNGFCIKCYSGYIIK